jgi:hypothetical protein
VETTQTIKYFMQLLYNVRYLFLLLLLYVVITYLPYVVRYYRSDYRKESGIGLFKFLFSTDYTGEGFTFIELENIPQYSKILTNLYIPTEYGTTEIDLVYITTSSVYVIESKNYNGKIYGSSKSKEWSTYIRGRKYKFYNPIWQNNNHIKYLQEVLPDIKLNSLIVFSERCQFNKMYANKDLVLKRNDLKARILKDKENEVLSNNEIDELYIKLKQYANKSKEEKQDHIDRLNKNKGS